MKRLCFTLILLLFVLPAFAEDIQEEGTSLGEFTHINVIGARITATNESGGVATITMQDTTAENEEVIQFTPADFLAVSDSVVYILTTSATSGPYVALNNNAASLVWLDGSISMAQVTLRVPSDYSSGGTFRALCDSDATTTPTQVDFSLFINTDGAAAWDAAASDQTPVALARVFSSPEVVTLSPDATDAALIAANSFITINVWRDDTATGTDNLEMYWLGFYYNSVQNN